mgnify:CR=1 FL=1|jgi:hypothetical protein
MALFEMSPPHTHHRGANLAYALVFSLGVACASLAEFFEEAATEHAAAASESA